jgi:hypothetical protein
MNAIEFYSKHLMNHFANKCGMDLGQITSIIRRFESLASTENVEDCASLVLENFGSCDTEKEIRTIREALEQANKYSVEGQPLVRAESYVERFNKNIDAMSVEIDGIDESNLADHQKSALAEARRARNKDAIKLTAPSSKLAYNEDGTLKRPFYYTAICSESAKVNGEKLKSFEIEWTL